MTDQAEPRRNQVDRVYARALFEMAEEQGALEEVADEMDQLAELMRQDAGLRRLLTSRSLNAEDRAAAIERTFKSRISDVFYRFLQVLNRKDRIAELPGIAEAMADLINEHRGIVEVDAFVPQRLDEHEAGQLAERLGQIMNKQVALHQYVDESLIGGLKLRVGDRLIDGSVASQLRRLRSTLERVGREKARDAAAEGAEGPRGRVRSGGRPWLASGDTRTLLPGRRRMNWCFRSIASRSSFRRMSDSASRNRFDVRP